MRAWMMCLVASGACAACSGDNAVMVDCSWFTGANCYKALAAEAGACLAMPAAGTLASDRTSCSYTDGSMVTFTTSVPVMAQPSYPWDLDVTVAGRTCMHFSDFIDVNAGMRTFTLTTASGTFVFDARGDRWDLTCPDGTLNRISMVDAFNCGLVGNPSKSTTSSGTQVSLTLYGTATTTTPVFTCRP